MYRTTWNLFDVWGNETVMPTSIAAQVLNGSISVSNATGYYNATETSFAEGLAANNSILFGTPAGQVAAGGTLAAEVPRHGVRKPKITFSSYSSSSLLLVWSWTYLIALQPSYGRSVVLLQAMIMVGTPVRIQSYPSRHGVQMCYLLTHAYRLRCTGCATRVQ